jgi:hypothetical protein
VCDEDNGKQLGIKIQKACERDVDGKNALSIFNFTSYSDFKCFFVMHYSLGV